MEKVSTNFVYVPANEIWPTAKPYTDEGLRPGLVRGYNVEVKWHDGDVCWMSTDYIRGTIEEYLNDGFTVFWFDDLGVTPTGRICFRGYGREDYNIYERETFIIPTDADGNPIEEERCCNA